MITVRLFAITLTAVLATMEPALAQEPPSSRSITVRVYDMFDVDARDMHAARRIAADIFGRAGFALSWRMCPRVVPDGSAACRDIVEPTELLVRIVAAPAQMAPVVLGYSFVEPQTHTGALSTVLADRVQRHAARARIPFASLLGRTIAHELGHLVLGTTDHSGGGLMQARWSDEVLRLGMLRDVRFSSVDEARMATMFSSRRTPAAMALAALAPAVESLERTR